MNKQDFLIEIGTEELPPKGLLALSQSFAERVLQGLQAAELEFSSYRIFATPRRIAVLVQDLVAEQPSRSVERRGPTYQAAFDENGQPSQACISFAHSLGTTPEKLSVLENDKGKWVVFRAIRSGSTTCELLPDIIQNAISKLTMNRPMRWGNYPTVFIRPVHWIVMLYGNQVIEATLLGKKAGRETYGHRIHHPKTISLEVPADYEMALQQAYVVADFAKRQALIQTQVQRIGEDIQAQVVVEEALLQEVTALVEWPVALLGQFDVAFLTVPAEALIAAMRDHQKCFYLIDKQEKLLPYFVTVANLVSESFQNIVTGNERVMRARLADAAFFFQTDCKQPLSARLAMIEHVVYQAKLGSLYDKSQRLKKLASHLATVLDGDIQQAERAATLAKCDLVTAMVGEFPELQGIMGYHYALCDGEEKTVALALKEQYLPRFSQDMLPTSLLGAIIALAERLDNLVGIIGLNQKPSGDKDPYQLRRAAIGVVRIIVEKKLDLDIVSLLKIAAKNYESMLPNKEVVTEVHDFILERLRAWYLEKGITPDVIAAVLVKQTTSFFDLDRRITAVTAFRHLIQADALAAANKRVSRILQKENPTEITTNIDSTLLIEKAEQTLAELLMKKKREVIPLFQTADYTTALNQLASLREPIDRFFDEVMVIVDDVNIRRNRLALLMDLHCLFTEVADISLLQPQQEKVA